MNEIKLYPLLTKENKFMGLEMIDFLVILLVYLAIFLASKNLVLNLSIVAGAYFALRIYKRNKPHRYTQNLIRFLLSPGRYTESWEASWNN